MCIPSCSIPIFKKQNYQPSILYNNYLEFLSFIIFNFLKNRLNFKIISNIYGFPYDIIGNILEKFNNNNNFK